MLFIPHCHWNPNITHLWNKYYILKSWNFKIKLGWFMEFIWVWVSLNSIVHPLCTLQAPHSPCCHSKSKSTSPSSSWNFTTFNQLSSIHKLKSTLSCPKYTHFDCTFPFLHKFQHEEWTCLESFIFTTLFLPLTFPQNLVCKNVFWAFQQIICY
jgi:hypothetical protein